MATITPEDLHTTVYNFMGYYNKFGDKNPEVYLVSGSGQPIIPRTSSGAYYNSTTDRNLHFAQIFEPFSFSLVEDVVNHLHPEDVPQYKLKMILGVPGDVSKIAYLPYYDNNITSTPIPSTVATASLRYFMTGNLSGCNVYIDQRAGGLVCYHANAGHVDAANAQATMDEMHRNAAAGGDVNKATLTQADYYTKALELEAEVVEGQTNRTFVGGTTVMGFQKVHGWEFWYQTYGRLLYTPTGGREIRLNDAPLRIIDVGRIWPK